MAHLKRVRKLDGKMSKVLIFKYEHPEPPTLPEDIDLPPPYITAVPKTAALTMTSLKLKSALWPTIYAPRKKYEPEPWSRGKVRWACEAMKEVVKAARAAGEKGEVRTSMPCLACCCSCICSSCQSLRTFRSLLTRRPRSPRGCSNLSARTIYADRRAIPFATASSTSCVRLVNCVHLQHIAHQKIQSPR